MVKFMTGRMLLKELEGYLMLSEYCMIVLDETHERNLNTEASLRCSVELLR